MKEMRVFVILILCLVLLGITTDVQAGVKSISVDELFQMLEEPETVIIDVRKNSDWEKSNRKIQGAVRENPWKTEEWFADYPKDKKYVLYCA